MWLSFEGGDVAESRFWCECASGSHHRHHREWAVDPGDCQQLQDVEELVAEGVTEVCATKPSFEFRGAALQDVVAVNGMSFPVTASNLSEPKYLVEKGVTEGVVVNGCRHSRSLCDHYYSEQASCVDVWLGFKGGVGAES